jgi:hypothetical protein
MEDQTEVNEDSDLSLVECIKLAEEQNIVIVANIKGHVFRVTPWGIVETVRG